MAAHGWVPGCGDAATVLGAEVVCDVMTMHAWLQRMNMMS